MVRAICNHTQEPSHNPKQETNTCVSLFLSVYVADKCYLNTHSLFGFGGSWGLGLRV